MKTRYFLFCIIIFVHSNYLFCQQGEKIMFMPIKYVLPSPDMDLLPDQFYSNQPWRVYADRNNIQVYKDEFLSQRKIASLNFLDDFFVWQEKENTVRLVEAKDKTKSIYSGKTFNDNAVEVGWVLKEKLILWDRVLKESNLTAKAIVNTATNTNLINPDKPYRIFNNKDSTLQVYNILKFEKNDNSALLSSSDLMNESLTEEDVFWIPKKSLYILKTRNGFVPDWKLVRQGQNVEIFNSQFSAERNISSQVIWRTKNVLPYVGFLEIKENNQPGKIYQFVGNSPGMGYVNESNKIFKRSILVDVYEYTLLQKFAKILGETSSIEELEESLNVFFKNHGVDKSEGKTISELLTSITGIEFHTDVQTTNRSINSISTSEYYTYKNIFLEKLENIESITYLSDDQFTNQIPYYWLPEELLSINRIGNFMLSGSSVQAKKEYNIFDIFYIDNSQPDKPYTQINKEIKKLDISLSKIWENERFGYGHAIYFSDGLDPILGNGETTFNSITGQMRQRRTNIPDKYFDKTRYENYLFSNIDKVTNELKFHFLVSDKFYNDAKSTRKVLLEEFVKRIMELLGTSETEVVVYLYVYNGIKNQAIPNDTEQRKVVDHNQFLSTTKLKYQVYSL